MTMATTSTPSSIPSAPSSATSATTEPTSAVAIEERLSSLLNSSSFSVASYLNIALQNSDADDLQQRMAQLALQLQMQTQSCHEDIGRIGAELQAILPRCAADVGRVGIGLEGMRMDAETLLEDCQAFLETDDKEALSSSLETLSTLHALRSNLSHTKDILQAAATWDSTLSSIAPLLASPTPNLTEAVAALAQLESGERALRGMASGKEERAEAIATLRHQVQVLLQPQLQHALQNMHTRLGPLQQCVSLYEALDKLPLLQQEYTQQRPSVVHKLWFAFASTTPPRSVENPSVPPATPAAPPTQSFRDWLPTWYDAILSLLTEERRQGLAVFGPELAPTMMCKVLAECFRPLSGSFQARLESVHSLSDVTGTGSGSLESICALYEATLQFLTLAYEAVAGSWHDVADASQKSTAGAVLYKDISKVLLQVAAPFKPYQQQLAVLEKQYSSISQQLIAKDIQGAGGVDGSIDALQDATEKLKGLAPFIFPQAEAAVARVELLTGGYRIRESLSTIDALLSKHAGELAIATQTLSASMTSSLADSFDDQHVSCALEVLKVAGTFQRALAKFEGTTKDRTNLLAQRMVAFAAQEKELHDEASFLLPDALSVVEIDSILTKTALSEDDHDEDDVERHAASLQRIESLYPAAREANQNLSKSCHAFVFDVCSAVPRKHLEGLSLMKCWTKTDSGGGGYNVDSYGTLPQQYITLVGEHMLALVQALEPFASDPESLSLANEVMDGVRTVSLQPWKEVVSTLNASDGVVEELMVGKQLVEQKLIVSQFEEDEDVDDGVDDDDDGKASAAFCNLWLDVVGLAVTGRLVERILRIARLTTKGCDHLAADLNYLVNVLAALGVTGHPHPLVGHLAELAVQDGGDLRKQISERKRTTPLEIVLRLLEERIAVMRGVMS